MNITIKAPDGHEINTTKGEANLALRDYIRTNCPEADAEIREANAQVNRLRKEIQEVRERITLEYGFSIY